jgi:GT2 family glycosyltransferase
VGDVAALAPVELANGLWVAVSGKHQRSVQFDMLDQSQGSGPPRRGVRLTTGRVADQVTAHLALPALPAAGEAFELGTLAWLPEATAPAMQVVGELWLTRQANGAFAPLRRLRRVGLFRKPSRVSATVVLSEEERASPGTLWLSVVAKESRGLCVMPPSLAAPDAAAGDRMEDARLEASFHALAEMVRLHGEALAAHPLLPFAAAPVAVQAATPGAHPPTQVVVPVYNGDLVVRDCLRSLRAAATPEMRVLVVDDGSRDFTAGLLAAEFGSDPRFEFLRRDLNRGYTKSINEAVLLTTAPWLVVLNSDTLVPPGWLARLHAAVRARPGTGMAGPLSNAATWQSIPAVKRQDGTWSTNDMIAPRHLAAVQALLDRESERAYPEFPVLNGFCTLIARAVFDRVGRYDEDAFPMGYGEETDLCLRARRAGFRLTVADDGFVFHHKSVSFGSATRSRLTRAGGLELGNKHLGANIGALEQAMQACQPLQRLRTRLAGPLAELD